MARLFDTIYDLDRLQVYYTMKKYYSTLDMPREDLDRINSIVQKKHSNAAERHTGPLAVVIRENLAMVHKDVLKNVISVIRKEDADNLYIRKQNEKLKL